MDGRTAGRAREPTDRPACHDAASGGHHFDQLRLLLPTCGCDQLAATPAPPRPDEHPHECETPCSSCGVWCWSNLAYRCSAVTNLLTRRFLSGGSEGARGAETPPPPPTVGTLCRPLPRAPWTVAFSGCGTGHGSPLSFSSPVSPLFPPLIGWSQDHRGRRLYDLAYSAEPRQDGRDRLRGVGSDERAVSPGQQIPGPPPNPQQFSV